jgi:hypothetical protein
MFHTSVHYQHKTQFLTSIYFRRVTAVQNKIANSVRMAKRLAVILERAKKNEKRVLKGLAF